MKTNTILLVILILFQSCYSYKKVAIKNLTIDTTKKYAIKTKKVNGRTFKHHILKITDTELITKKKGKVYTFPINKILKIEEMKFSFWRTGILSTIIIVPTILYIALYDLIHWK